MPAYRARPEPEAPRKLLSLPPALDMGLLKIEDLEFDLDREVARLRAADGSRPQGLPSTRDLELPYALQRHV